MRRLLVPAVSTLVMLAVLLGLGTWQLERLAWKQGILARIAAAEAGPPQPLPASPAPYRKVRAEGVLRWDKPALYGAEGRDLPSGPTLGAQLLVPLERRGAPTVLAMLGWVPALPPARPPAPGTVVGYVRPGERPGMFSATDDPAGRRFYTLDPPIIAHTLGLGPVAPFVIVALGPAGDTPPIPAQHLPRPPNNHLSYAITWYGLAATLAVIFVLYARKVLRP
jgi:surfeit locus 1 family protein